MFFLNRFKHKDTKEEERKNPYDLRPSKSVVSKSAFICKGLNLKTLRISFMNQRSFNISTDMVCKGKKLYHRRFSKKSFPLSSTRINAGKFFTVIINMASMPSSGYSMISTFVMHSLPSLAAGPPMEPR